MPTTKRCSKCKEDKELKDFCRNRTSRDGLNGWCRACHSEALRAYRQIRMKNRDPLTAAKDQARDRAKYWANPGPIRLRSRVYQCNKVEYADSLSDGSVTVDAIKELLRLQDGRCAVTGEPFDDDWQIDHIWPNSKGGENTMANIHLVKTMANLEKHANIPWEYCHHIPPGWLFPRAAGY